ncbi:MAG: RluA family pseudouridine synthase [Erysipelotrichaceae bacterium]|nr:RluA family pseudouridine synthase [Erysipelotrichaceae bacterium]
MKTVRKYTVSDQQNGMTLGSFLLSHGLSKNVITKLKKNPEGLTVNGERKHTNFLLSPADQVVISLEESSDSWWLKPTEMPLEVIYEDRDLLIVNKQPYLQVHPSRNNTDLSLANGIAWYLAQSGENTVFHCVNRLDKNTSGLTMIVKNQIAAGPYSEMVGQRKIQREYLAMVTGKAPESGIIDAPIGRLGEDMHRIITPDGKPSVSHYRLVAWFPARDASLVRLKLDTGRTHQIRVHMAHIGHPLIGDSLYNGTPSAFPRQGLQAYHLTFRHPDTGTSMNFTLPLDREIAEYLEADPLITYSLKKVEW